MSPSPAAASRVTNLLIIEDFEQVKKTSSVERLRIAAAPYYSTPLPFLPLQLSNCRGYRDCRHSPVCVRHDAVEHGAGGEAAWPADHAGDAVGTLPCVEWMVSDAANGSG